MLMLGTWEMAQESCAAPSMTMKVWNSCDRKFRMVHYWMACAIQGDGRRRNEYRWLSGHSFTKLSLVMRLTYNQPYIGSVCLNKLMHAIK
jgi:hypothetical protein